MLRNYLAFCCRPTARWPGASDEHAGLHVRSAHQHQRGVLVPHTFCSIVRPQGALQIAAAQRRQQAAASPRPAPYAEVCVLSRARAPVHACSCTSCKRHAALGETALPKPRTDICEIAAGGLPVAPTGSSDGQINSRRPGLVRGEAPVLPLPVPSQAQAATREEM